MNKKKHHCKPIALPRSAVISFFKKSSTSYKPRGPTSFTLLQFISFKSNYTVYSTYIPISIRPTIYTAIIRILYRPLGNKITILDDYYRTKNHLDLITIIGYSYYTRRPYTIKLVPQIIFV